MLSVLLIFNLRTLGDLEYLGLLGHLGSSSSSRIEREIEYHKKFDSFASDIAKYIIVRVFFL